MIGHSTFFNNTLCPKPPLFRGGCNGHETTSIYYASTSWYTRDISRPTIARKLSSLQPSFKILKSFEFEYTKGCNGQNKDHPPSNGGAGSKWINLYYEKVCYDKRYTVGFFFYFTWYIYNTVLYPLMLYLQNKVTCTTGGPTETCFLLKFTYSVVNGKFELANRTRFKIVCYFNSNIHTIILWNFSNQCWLHNEITERSKNPLLDNDRVYTLSVALRHISITTVRLGTKCLTLYF